jgi:hypothetical protein
MCAITDVQVCVVFRVVLLSLTIRSTINIPHVFMLLSKYLLLKCNQFISYYMSFQSHTAIKTTKMTMQMMCTRSIEVLKVFPSFKIFTFRNLATRRRNLQHKCNNLLLLFLVALSAE